ncbi:hypothetical protein [Geodermatophilus sp. FMUSA9-8]|uniref:hypothetical protein n=1 Tax=Geodermatophilus sp. FMUSA9-8 TaxID=3120155 RepID=UPI00300937FC
MSSTGPAIFDDDLACDVRDSYRKLLEERVADDEATRRSTEDWAELGPDEYSVFWLALAAAQSQLGRLDPNVRQRALDVIDSGQDLARWRTAAPGLAVERAAVLQTLREQLAGPQPSRKTVRRPWREVTDLQAGMVLARTASNGTVALLRVVQRLEDAFDHTVRPVLERLAWTGPRVPSAEVLAKLPAAAGAEAQRRAAIEGNRIPGIFIPLRPNRRHPDWAELGFTVCGQIAARPGDEGDWLPRASYVHWDALTYFLDLDLDLDLEVEVAGPSGDQ